MFTKKILNLIIIFIFTFSIVYSQEVREKGCTEIKMPVGKGPCKGEIPRIPYEPINYVQSSTLNGLGIKNAFDKNNSSFSLTKLEKNSWVELDYGSSITFNYILINEELSYYHGGLKNFYIFTSDVPFRSHDLAKLIADPCIDYVKIDKARNGSEIPLSGMKGQFLSLQLEDYGQLAIVGIGTGGVKEICGNDIDDDCDGLTDCDDPDCNVNVFNTITVHPTCPICNDGSISIQAFTSNGNVQISTDGGETWSEVEGSLWEMSGLDEGVYTILVSNGNCETEITFILEAPVTTDETNCENGGFESGDFTNWTTEAGTINAGTSEVDPTTNGGFSIMQSGQITDSNLPSGGSIASPTGGTYIGVLGQNPLSGGSDMFTMSNCFEVTSSNANFAFNYSLVLEDPNHLPHEQPSFSWSIFPEGNPSAPIDGEFVTAGTSFFENQNGLSTKGWSAECIDLGNFIGNVVCIEFTISECNQNGHGGYAYIDGICEDSEGNKPNCDFELDSEAMCNNDEFNLIFSSEANNFDTYTINICDSNGNCTDNSATNGYSIGAIDVKSISGGTIDFVNGETYTVEVTLENECGECTSSKEFVFHNVNLLLDYPPYIYVCNDVESVVIPGSVNCTDCTIEWSPSAGFLTNSNSPNPTVSTELNVLAFQQSYSITATYEEDGMECVSSSSVQFDENSIIMSCEDPVSTRCADKFKCTFSAPFDIYPSDFDIFYLNQKGDKFIPNATQVTSNSIEYQLEVNNSVDYSLTYFGEFIGTRDFIFGTSCFETEAFLGYFNASRWYRASQIHIPNIFSPNGDGISDYFFPSFTSKKSDCTLTVSNITWAELTIYDRWGGIISQKEASNPNGLIGGEVAWDGIIVCDSNGDCPDNTSCQNNNCHYSNGEVAYYSPAFTYTYTLRYKVGYCSNSLKEQCSTGNSNNGPISYWITENGIISGSVNIKD